MHDEAAQCGAALSGGAHGREGDGPDGEVQVGGGSDDRVRPLAHRIKGAASMVGAVRLAELAANLEAGGSKEAATPGVFADLLNACSELERMLLAGNLTKTT